MAVPGLIAFGIYRLAKQELTLSDPLTLLILSGVVSLLTAAGAYRVGRRLSVGRVALEDGGRRVLWILGWIGFMYGVQLSLLVLALLWLVGYDYAKHPDGPAMMAIIIACSAVARDAFEIGHVRWLQVSGRPFSTFPDGHRLRELLGRFPRLLWQWVGTGILSTVCVSLAVPISENAQIAVLMQVAVVTLMAAGISLAAFFAGQGGEETWMSKLTASSWGELTKFFWWPGMAFASTYHLVLIGLVLYVAGMPRPASGVLALIAGVVGGIMALYAYYLGHRRQVENLEQQVVSPALLRCPFVMGILGSSRTQQTAGLETTSVLGKSGQRM